MTSPLSACDGGLSLGNTLFRHARFTSSGMEYLNGDHPPAEQLLDYVPWPDIASVRPVLARMRWPSPGLRDWTMPMVQAALGDTLISVKPNSLFWTDTAGVEHYLEIDGHHPGGYGRRRIALAERILDFLASRPDATRLLDNPDAVDALLAGFRG